MRTGNQMSINMPYQVNIHHPVGDNKNSIYTVIAFFLFLIYFFIGIFLFRDYGVSWDEIDHYNHGLINFSYVYRCMPEPVKNFLDKHMELDKKTENVTPLKQYINKDYGSHELFIFIISKTIKSLAGLKDIYYDFKIRHAINFIICFLGSIFFYLAVRNIYSSKIALLSTLLYIIFPRYFAEQFYNPTDLVLLSAYSLNLYVLSKLFINNTISNVIFFSFTTSIAICIRIVGLNLFFSYIGVLFLLLFLKNISLKLFTRNFIFYFIFTFLFTYCMYPSLWEDPFKSVIEIFRNMSHFRWGGTFLFLGELVRSTRAPIYYLPVWISLTLPPIILFSFIAGSLLFISKFIKVRKCYFLINNLLPLYSLVIIIGSYLAIVILHSVLYDGWRHFYFIYPPIMIIVSYFINNCINTTTKFIKYLYFIFYAISCIYCINFLCISHPVQNVYFNFLLPPQWKDKMDTDYWGLSNQSALEFILANDSREKINIFPGAFMDLGRSLLGLRESERKRFEIPKLMHDADYIITTFRRVNHKDQFFIDNGFYPIFSLTVNGNIINRIYKKDSNFKHDITSPSES